MAQKAGIPLQDNLGIERIRLPDVQTLFAQRAARLRQLADGNAIGDYMRFAAHIADAQQRCLATCTSPALTKAQIYRAQHKGVPVIDLSDALLPQWKEALKAILSTLEALSGLPPQFNEMAAQLRDAGDTALDAQARAWLVQYPQPVACAPFIAASLQVAYAVQAAQLDLTDVPYLDALTLCPVCGSLPVTSVIRPGEQAQQYRYLHCGVCETEWHLVRIKCSHCGGVEGIAYEHIAGAFDAVQAETCSKCHTYCKIIDQEKERMAEPLADDLATLTLDMLMAEQTSFTRAALNPLLPFAAIEPGERDE